MWDSIKTSYKGWLAIIFFRTSSFSLSTSFLPPLVFPPICLASICLCDLLLHQSNHKLRHRKRNTYNIIYSNLPWIKRFLYYGYWPTGSSEVMKRIYQQVQMGLPAVWVFLFFMLLTNGGKIVWIQQVHAWEKDKKVKTLWVLCLPCFPWKELVKVYCYD